MSTKGEQQEAVCGTCKIARLFMCHDPEPLPDVKCGRCGIAVSAHHTFIPAPVVPSDDRGYEWAPPPQGKPTPTSSLEEARDRLHKAIDDRADCLVIESLVDGVVAAARGGEVRQVGGSEYDDDEPF